ncbi:PTS fructose transporter subunit IIA [bacterium]|nr:PTS fructose transporter subunit IIA [bacterium]
MIGVVVVTHGRLAEEFVAAAVHVVGPQDRLVPVCIGPDDDMDMRRREIIAAAKGVDDGSGVVILTDMFGGTPCNLAISVMGSGQIEVIAGANLPMLITLCETRAKLPLAEACERAADAGRRFVSVVSKLLQRA